MSDDRPNASDSVDVVAESGEANDPAAEAEAGEGSQSRDRYRHTVAILSVATAAMTLVSAVLGVVGYNARQDKVEAQAQATLLAEQAAELSVELNTVESQRESAQEQADAVRQERDELQEQLDQLLPSPGPIDPNTPAPGAVYLANEDMVTDYRYTKGSGQIRGTVYPSSVMTAPHSCQEAFVTHAEYDLALQYTRLTATIGMSDKNEIFNRRAKFEIILDNELIYEHTLTGGAATQVDVSVTGGLRLRLQTTFYESQDCNFVNDADQAVWGDIAVHQ